MKIQFLGAAGFVTGSCYLVTHSKGMFLVDCGLYQGKYETEKYNDDKFLFEPSKLDFVILTHAHLDHCGLLPKLTKAGFKGRIFATPATKDLAEIVMTDEANIQENGARHEQFVALFGQEDVKKALTAFETYPYKKEFSHPSGVKICFQDAGHILGSAMMEVWVENKKITFSGDIGNYSIPIMNNPTDIPESDFVVCESTYGGRLHEPVGNRTDKLKTLIQQAAKNDYKVLIPVFAIERTQDVLYQLDNLFNQADVSKVKTYLDSPMAIKVTNTYKKYFDLLDEDFQKFRKEDFDPLDFPNLELTETVDESKAINDRKGAMIVLAGSGMADAGRIVHHLRNNLADPKTHVVFVGFQVPGTTGRALLDGAKEIRLFGETIPVHATIESIESFSAHADQDGLLKWLSGFKNKPKIFIAHGEDTSRGALAEKIKTDLGCETVIPKLFEIIEL